MKPFICLCIVLVLAACSPKKPPLNDTQIVNGKSIIIPPEFDVIPKGENN